jgi:hypothetical protein
MANLQKKIFDKIRSENTTASNSTVNMYASNISKIVRDMDIKEDEFTVNDLLDHDKILNYLKTNDYTLNTIKNKISSIVAYLVACEIDKKLIEKYIDDIDSYSAKIERDKKKMVKTKREEVNWMTLQELKDYMNNEFKLLPKSLKTYHDFYMWMKYLSGEFHLLYPMRNELADLKIFSHSEYKKVDEGSKYNYLILNQKSNTMKMILNKYKTYKVYGQKQIIITDPFLIEMFTIYYRALKLYFKENVDLEFKNFFLFHKDGSHFTRNDFTKLLNSTFSKSGKRISTSLIRKIVVSELYPVSKIRDMAYIMAHSPSEAVHSYIKS